MKLIVVLCVLWCTRAADGGLPSWLSKYGIPRGCSTLSISRCSTGHDIATLLSSTSPWFQLQSNTSIYYTTGIVFIEVNELAIPMSVTGVELAVVGDDITVVTGSLSLERANGIRVGGNRTQHCISLDLVPSDRFGLQEYLPKMFLDSLNEKLPGWLWFSETGVDVVSVNGFHTELTKGKYIQQGVCQGTPVFDEHLYTVVQLNQGFNMSVYGHEVSLPNPLHDKQFCFIIDICEDYGGTMFMTLPENSRDLFDDMGLFRKLTDTTGIYIRPTGIGLSLFRHINVQSHTSDLQLWNGYSDVSYPVFPNANLWVAGGLIMDTAVLELSADTQVYIKLPDISNLYKNIFLEEWEILLDLDTDANVKLSMPVFGTKYSLLDYYKVQASGSVDLYANLGGRMNEDLCDTSNRPKGLFFSAIAGLHVNNMFGRIPVLGDMLHIYGQVDVAVSSHPSIQAPSDTYIDLLLHEILDVVGTFERFKNLTLYTVARYDKLIEDQIQIYVTDIVDTTQALITKVAEPVKALIDGQHVSIKEDFVFHVIESLESGLKNLSRDTDYFIESLKSSSLIAQHDFVSQFEEEKGRMRASLGKALERITNETKSLLSSVNGFGIRARGGIDIYGLTLGELSLEFFYSEDYLGGCGKYSEAFSLLEDQTALRIYASASSDLIKLSAFLKLRSLGFGIAIGLDGPVYINGNGPYMPIATQFTAELSLLGLKIESDTIITSKGLYILTEATFVGVYKAQLEVTSPLGALWSEQQLEITGKFLADADDDGNFQDSYLSALTGFTQRLADDAEERINQAQDGFDSAISSLTSVQDWLEEKKDDVYSANSAFDHAIDKLEDAKDALERAKIPFQNAIDSLNDAQRAVDNLCSIRTCRDVCVPGLSCDICWKKVLFVSVPYPCCSTTSCMFKIPNVVCEAANLACRAVRGVAYVALEVAKAAVSVPLAALDVCKAAVSVAQVVVDKSRVVLDIAVAALDLASAGLEVAKIAVRTAEIALEAVKQVVKWGVKAMNFIIEYGIQSLIDVRNCGFELTLSTPGETVFDVHCEVNAFRSGFRRVEFGINFSNIVESIWNAAKATIESILEAIGDVISGRKRRRVLHESLTGVYRVLRETRSIDIADDDFEERSNKTLNVVLNTIGFRHSRRESDYGTRKAIFSEKCEQFMSALNFLSNATDLLMAMTSDTSTVLGNVSNLLEEIKGVNFHDVNETFTVYAAGIDLNFAHSYFNMSQEEIVSTLEIAKNNAAADPMLSVIDSISKDARSLIQNQTKNMNKVMITRQWISAMDNITGTFFGIDRCISFLDCAHYSVTLLYDMNIVSNKALNEQSLDAISVFETTFLHLIGNNTLTILDAFGLASALSTHLDKIQSTNIFCSKPPTSRSSLQNTTVVIGDTLSLTCDADGKPEPDIWWYKDDTILPDHTDKVLTIRNVSMATEGVYYCVAGNVVANLTFDEAYVTITAEGIGATELGGGHAAEGHTWTAPSLSV